jgi:YVTN family beta-propeller protein
MTRMTGLSSLKRSLCVASLALGLGCGVPEAARQSTSAGSLALSTDDSLLYAADTDNGILAVVDTATQTKIAQVKVGAQPYRVVVGQDDTIFVANRGSRSISVIRKGDWSEAARIPTGVDPVGMQLGLDGKTLYVVSTP